LNSSNNVFVYGALKFSSSLKWEFGRSF